MLPVRAKAKHRGRQSRDMEQFQYYEDTVELLKSSPKKQNKTTQTF